MTTESANAEFSILEDQIRECFGRVVYTHKTHEKMADLCGDKLRWFKIGQIVVSALTASGVFTMLFYDPMTLKIVNAVLAIFALLISNYMKGFDPGGTAQKHRDTAANIWPIRESYLSLLTDLRTGRIDANMAAKVRDDLQAKLAAIYKGAPQTTFKAYTKAQDALKSVEDYTFSDAELDKFVPLSMRKGK